MCTRPISKDGNTFACRTCDECIATRRHGWIARAMAEKTGHKHTLCVALTYGEDTREQRDAARMFCYADVRAFMARLRDTLRRKKLSGSVRFLCAGEQGDRYGRCHWHLILYSDADLTQIGEFTHYGRAVTDRAQMMTIGKRKRRLHWSLWGNGFVTLQEPDEGGMAYVLSYCLKDQFTEEKSHGTMREAKAENFATGLFRMSKRPAIGEDFLMRKMEALEATASVLPSLQIKIPDMSGYWHPNGTFREKLLWCLVALNRRTVWATGADAPQWAALVASCRDNSKDMEILCGKEIEQEDDAESDEAIFARRAREMAGNQRRGEIARRCGSVLPCRDCLHELSDDQLTGIGVQRLWPEDGSEWQYDALPGFGHLAERRKESLGHINPYCQQRGSKIARLTFPATGGASGHGTNSKGQGLA